MNLHTQHATPQTINRLLFARKPNKALDAIAAVVIGAGLALALVAWWSA